MQNEPIAASIEVSPKHALEMADLDLVIPQGVRTYITDIGTHSTRDMARACERVNAFGLKAVPHIAARRLSGEVELKEKITSYAAAGVTDVLVIGGGADQLQGEIHSTMQVLETGLLDANGITEIGVAGHPEGTPDFSDEVAEIALRLKKEFAERTGARMRIVTQFGFDPETFIDWAEGLSQIGNDLPVHLGVAGPAKTMTLLKYAAMCGVGNSIGFLKKHAGAVTALAASHSPESVVGPIESHVQNAERTAIRGVHVFPFGGLQNTSRWLIDRGSWPILQQLSAANRA